LPVIAKSALRVYLVSIDLLQLYGCAIDVTLAPEKVFIVNNTGMGADDGIRVLKFNHSICEINKDMAMAMAAIAQISESCIAKKHPTCSRWYQENLDGMHNEYCQTRI